MEIYVQSGDSLWFYSQLYNVPLTLIIQSNPNISPTQLRIGQQILIPGYELVGYQVQPNDTLWKIATNHYISIDALIRANPGINPNNLQIGQNLSLPNRVTDIIVEDPSNYTYVKMIRDINRLINIYPFIRNTTIGQSILGKD